MLLCWFSSLVETKDGDGMTQEHWDELSVVYWLEGNGYKGFLSSEYAFYLHDKDRSGLRIAVFGEDYPHSKLRGSIAAEMNRTFDKWSKVYYLRPIPQTEEEREQMLLDLVEIRSEYHMERACQFMTFDFVESKKDDSPKYKNQSHRAKKIFLRR